jgi:hypothetical protein
MSGTDSDPAGPGVRPSSAAQRNTLAQIQRKCNIRPDDALWEVIDMLNEHAGICKGISAGIREAAGEAEKGIAFAFESAGTAAGKMIGDAAAASAVKAGEELKGIVRAAVAPCAKMIERAAQLVEISTQQTMKAAAKALEDIKASTDTVAEKVAEMEKKTADITDAFAAAADSLDFRAKSAVNLVCRNTDLAADRLRGELAEWRAGKRSARRALAAVAILVLLAAFWGGYQFGIHSKDRSGPDFDLVTSSAPDFARSVLSVRAAFPTAGEARGSDTPTDAPPGGLICAARPRGAPAAASRGGAGPLASPAGRQGLQAAGSLSANGAEGEG